MANAPFFMHPAQLVGIAVVACPVMASSAAADVQTSVVAARDTTLYQDPDGAWGNGAGDYVFAGRSGQADPLSRRRALLYFDLPFAIPPGSTVTAVRLRLLMSRTPEASAPVSVHRVLADWGEGASNAEGEEGGGAPSKPQDATWIHRYFPDQEWSAPGGDFVGEPSAVRDVIGIGEYVWESSAALVADVQGWVDDPDRNFGWILIGVEEFDRTVKRFASRENPVPGDRPTLLVEYVPPPIPATSTTGLVVVVATVLVVGVGILLRTDRAARPGAVSGPDAA